MTNGSANLSMNEAANTLAMPFRATKSGNGGIGGGGVKNKRWLKRKTIIKAQSGKIRKVSKKTRGANAVLKSVKALVIQEYSQVLPGTRWAACDLDHIHGRHADFPLTAMFDPRNLQLLNREQHSFKTNAPTREGQRMDYRTKEVQERLIAVAKRIEARLGGAWTTGELKKAVEFEIFSK